MRNPKAGDRCEYAVWNPKRMRKERVCEVRHLQGTPPGLLMPLTSGKEAALMCQKHAVELRGDWKGEPLSTRAVKRQKKGHTDSVHETLV